MSDSDSIISTLSSGRGKRWDAVVIGAGAAGSVFADRLTRAGLDVLLLEMGQRYDDHRNQFVENDGVFFSRVWSNRGYRITGDGFTGAPNLGFGVGGGTLVWTALTLRMFEQDFNMRSRYGRPDGTSVEDWPIKLRELEPYYDRAEAQMGVSGTATPWDTPTRRPLPNPPHRLYRASELLRGGMAREGIRSAPGPVAVASRDYRRQKECLHCGFCRAGCRVDAKYQADTALLTDALNTGRLRLLSGVAVTRIDQDNGPNQASGVTFVDLATNTQHKVRAKVVIAANNPIELPRLFLNSRNRFAPDGLGNAYDNVGRNFFAHPSTIALGVVDECMNTSIGYNMGNLISLDYSHDRGGDRFIGGFIMAALNGSGAGVMAVDPYRPLWGKELKQQMLSYNSSLLMVTFCEGMPVRDNRITVDPGRLDAFGMPQANIHYQLHANDRAVFAEALATNRRVMRAAGAKAVYTTDTPFDSHPAGTMRMGDDPRSSVTDRFGRVHGLRNVYVGGAALFPTGSSVNPTLTLHALALRTADHIVRNFAAHEEAA